MENRQRSLESLEINEEILRTKYFIDDILFNGGGSYTLLYNPSVLQA